ncbi:hypothetical protein LOK49_LG04G03535 [Camellia lanceoleosa]|uniref:Uncharacterized protein n=1 Tax=Camellia lanceoleosa TaxID=1840588 RepID=A0ACC0I0A1_9ERIC|nr:hypothetical protein LOK49_LG04G03535 [Camellia lanceoleosa]
MLFAYTIESSPCGDNCEGGANLIDLAGFESSKAETTGVRRKEGTYVNKSLPTLGTMRPQQFLFYQQLHSMSLNKLKLNSHYSRATNALKKQMWAEVQLDKHLHVIYSNEDQKFDKDITVGLICSELLNLAEYNVHMAKLLDEGIVRIKAATEFAISLIQTLLINDSKVYDALAKGGNVGHLHKLLGIESSSKAFLEHGIPDNPEMVVELMQKACFAFVTVLVKVFLRAYAS